MVRWDKKKYGACFVSEITESPICVVPVSSNWILGDEGNIKQTKVTSHRRESITHT